MIPDVSPTSERFRKSPGEAVVYAAMRNLPDSIVVIHGLATLTRHPNEEAPLEGEIDFLVIDPARGLLVLEVKGGEVQYKPDEDTWTISVKRGRTKRIADPSLRAANRLRDIRKQIADDEAFAALGIGESPGGHAVLLSDLDDLDELGPLRPNIPCELLGGRPILQDLPAWLDGVFRYHGVPAVGPGLAWLEHVRRIVARPFTLQPRLGVLIAQDLQRFDYWTDQQWQALQGTRFMLKVSVAGGAGTGKTLLAVRRAQELSRTGKRTLLLCFNALLGDHLKWERKTFLAAEPEAGQRLMIMTFHDLCRWWVGEVGARARRDFLAEARQIARGQDETHVVYPVALALAIEKERPNFQAVVIDEAQDFRRSYWRALKPLLEAPSASRVVFYDMNQRLLQPQEQYPFELSSSYVLDKNCRNGRAIHDATYHHYNGLPVSPNECDDEIRRWIEPTIESAAERLLAELLTLVVKQGVPRSDIVVLLLDGRLRDTCQAALEQRLKDRRLKLSFGVHFERAEDCIRVDTVGRFKGMEAAVIILWAQRWPTGEDDRAFLYVGLSRAQRLLVVLGPEDLVNRTLAGVPA